MNACVNEVLSAEDGVIGGLPRRLIIPMAHYECVCGRAPPTIPSALCTLWGRCWEKDWVSEDGLEVGSSLLLPSRVAVEGCPILLVLNFLTVHRERDLAEF